MRSGTAELASEMGKLDDVQVYFYMPLPNKCPETLHVTTHLISSIKKSQLLERMIKQKTTGE